jgi:hypothetical protein
MYALCSNCTAMAGYQTAFMPSAVTVLQWQDTNLHVCTLQSPYCNGMIPNCIHTLCSHRTAIAGYQTASTHLQSPYCSGRIPNCMYALCSNCTSMAGYQTACTHYAVTFLQWHDTKLHVPTLPCCSGSISNCIQVLCSHLQWPNT